LTSKSSETSYTEIAIRYAEAAIADKRRTWACEWIRLAARRFLRDLERANGKRPPFVFSMNHAERACRFIESLPHVEGKWETETLLLQPAQLFLVVQLFGFRDLDGGRRFTEALMLIARKNAKSTLAAAIMLCCFCLERENGPQLVSAATTGQQARIVWRVARDMIERTPHLRDTFGLECFANAITRAEVGGTFRPINAKASTQDGLNPSHANLDEIHAHKTHDLLNVLRSAAGARTHPLWLYTTTEGYETPGPWPELRNYAKQVLRGLFRADHFLACIWALDDDDPEDDELNEDKWVKANPLLPVNAPLLNEMRKLAVNARAMPGMMAEFRVKRLNRQAAAAAAWVDLHKWRRCGGPVDLEALRGAPCWGAFDLATTRDMTAWRLLWLLNGHFYTWGRYWVPAAAVAQMTERRSTPYAAWVKSGHLIQTEGETTDYGLIERQIAEDCERFQPARLAFDPWNAQSTVVNLANLGLELVQFVQGTRSYNPGMKAAEVAYTAGRLHHGGDPVLTWNMANVVARSDEMDNIAPSRKRSAGKIDGACCLFMCFGLANADDTAAFDRYLANPVTG
jgi:phage terminase large subunit-like protein